MAASPLVTVDWLRDHARDPNVVIVDVRWYLKDKRGIDAYVAGHLPNAFFLDIDADLSSRQGPDKPGRHPLPSAEQLASVLARIGVRPGDLVIGYDDSGGSTAARLWWLLEYFGHGGGRVLDGGIQAWVAAGLGLDTDTPSRAPAAPMKLVPRAHMVVDKAHVRQSSLSGSALILDARAPERFRGKIEPVDARPGHIPGAKNAPHAANLRVPAGAFRSAEELRQQYASLGAFESRPLIAYCGSGVTACHDLLALKIAGHEGALLYEGSWSDWAADPTLPAAREE